MQTDRKQEIGQIFADLRTARTNLFEKNAAVDATEEALEKAKLGAEKRIKECRELCQAREAMEKILHEIKKLTDEIKKLTDEHNAAVDEVRAARLQYDLAEIKAKELECCLLNDRILAEGASA